MESLNFVRNISGRSLSMSWYDHVFKECPAYRISNNRGMHHNISFQCGSVYVRVRRDANEQMVAAHVYDRLSNFVTDLTVHVFKDDWTRPVSYQVLSENSLTGRNGPPLITALPSHSAPVGPASSKQHSTAAFHPPATNTFVPVAPSASLNHFQQNGSSHFPQTINSQNLNSDILNLLGSRSQHAGSTPAQYLQSSQALDSSFSGFPAKRTDPDGATKVL